MRIVLVDDDPHLRAALRRYLERSGHDVVGDAHDGEQGLAMARQLDPDVVLMDLRMPKLTGTEAARLLRLSHPHIDVIMHSAFDDRALRRVAEKAGVQHYVVKGAGAAELVRILDELRAGREESAGRAVGPATVEPA